MFPSYHVIFLLFSASWMQSYFTLVDAFAPHFPTSIGGHEGIMMRGPKASHRFGTLSYRNWTLVSKYRGISRIENGMIQRTRKWTNNRTLIKRYSALSEFDWNTIPYANFFAFSLFPYLYFLYKMWKDDSSEFPVVSKLGFTYLLFFVFGTIVGGISSKVIYDELLANIDWIHGTAEALLGLTNVMVAVGFKRALDASRKLDPKDKPTKWT